MEMSTASDGWQAASIKYRKIVERLEAEIAALQQVMACGHPKACWREPSSVHPDGHCIMCVEKRLAVAAARLGAANFIRQHWGDSDMLADEWLKSKSDAQALDAHDAAIRERTLQEVFSRWDREGEQDTWNWLCETLDEEKREKRGSK